VDRRLLPPARLYALLELGIAASALVVPLLLGAATPLLQRVYDPQNADAPALGLLRLALSAAVLLVPTTLMGATLAVLVAVAAPEAPRVGVTAGTLYAWNTAGAIAGSLGGAVVLLPALGMRGTLAAAAGLPSVRRRTSRRAALAARRRWS
jgi:spermidine synthase